MRTFKYLGVSFDNVMIWKAYADYLCKKGAKRVSILGRTRGFMTLEAAILVYNILILPIFDYSVRHRVEQSTSTRS